MIRTLPFYCKFVIAFIALTISAAPADLHAQQKVWGDYFQVTDSISFEADTYFADVRFADIRDNGDLLLTSQYSSLVLFYQKDEDEATTLNPQNCETNYVYEPFQAFFLKDDSIFLQNTMSPGYRFTAEGKCLGMLDESYRTSRYISPTDSGMVGFSNFPNLDPAILFFDNQGVMTDSLSFSGLFLPNISSHQTGGGITSGGDGSVFLVASSSARVYQFSADGHPEYEIIPDFDIYNEAPRDLRDNMNYDQIMMEFSRLWRSYSFVRNLYNIDGLHLAIELFNQGSDEREKWLLIFDMQERRFYPNAISLPEHINFAGSGNGYLIEVRRSPGDATLESINPEIFLHRFNPEALEFGE